MHLDHHNATFDRHKASTIFFTVQIGRLYYNNLNKSDVNNILGEHTGFGYLHRQCRISKENPSLQNLFSHLVCYPRLPVHCHSQFLVL